MRAEFTGTIDVYWGFLWEGEDEMPELPEVETMVRGLRPALLGRTLRRVEVLDPFLVHGCPAGGPGAARVAARR